MRLRNKPRYPALPVAVKNLLALHGLEARVDVSHGMSYSARRYRCVWSVSKIREAVPGAFGLQPRPRYLSGMTASATLDQWTEIVGRYSRGERLIGALPELFMDFESWSQCPMKEIKQLARRPLLQWQAIKNSLRLNGVELYKYSKNHWLLKKGESVCLSPHWNSSPPDAQTYILSMIDIVVSRVDNRIHV